MSDPNEFLDYSDSVFDGLGTDDFGGDPHTEHVATLVAGFHTVPGAFVLEEVATDGGLGHASASSSGFCELDFEEFFPFDLFQEMLFEKTELLSDHLGSVKEDERFVRRHIEEIGKYHPTEQPSFIEVDSERAQHWLSVGAQPTEQVLAILKLTGDWGKFKGDANAVSTVKTAEVKAPFEIDSAKKSVVKPKAEKKAEEPAAPAEAEAAPAEDAE